MTPDTPQAGPRRSPDSGRNTADDRAAGSDLGSVPLGGGFDSPLRPAELSDQNLEMGDRTGSGFLGNVKEKATSQLNAQKTRATDQLDNIARSVRQSTRRLREERHDTVAAVLERGVQELEKFATTLRDRDINEFLADIERFGRRQPALFLGTSLAAGLMLARFAKATAPGAGGRRPDWFRGRSSHFSSYNRPGDGFTGQENL